ncbi:MAG TPA: TolC family protein, partial [Candidatus Sulfotelmatobacter sp.]
MQANPIIYAALLAFVLGGSELLAQSPWTALPNAPMTQSFLVASAQAGSVTNSPPPAGAEGTPTPLTRQEAEKLALANNPRIRITELIARVQHQAVRERRADELPNLNGNLTAVEANDGSRISSGSLTASRLAEHAGMGVQLSQLITDFGHTRNLVASA